MSAFNPSFIKTVPQDGKFLSGFQHGGAIHIRPDNTLFLPALCNYLSHGTHDQTVAREHGSLLGSRAIGRNKIGEIFKCPGPVEEKPMFKSGIRPGRGDQEKLGALVKDSSEKFGEPEIVAGGKPNISKGGRDDCRGTAPG